MSLQLDGLVQPVLKLTPDRAAWQRCKTLPEPAARWRIYLHQICAVALLAWLREEFDLPVRIWPEATPFDIWHVVNGVGLTLGHKRIVVLLDEAIDAAELRVPQEWVDIPSWIADYYVAAFVDVDEDQLVPWGYTTHAQLKTAGTYDASNRTYCLADTNLVQDFSVFWVAQQLEQTVPVPVEDLPSVAQSSAESLVQRLATAPDPRLEIPFMQWATLLSSDRQRQQLYRQRQGLMPVNLGQWTRQIFDPGWQALESLLSRPPALGFRTDTSDDTLTRGKTIQLKTSIKEFEFALVLAINVEADDRRYIRVQLYPSQIPVLPNRLSLTLSLPDSEAPLQTVQSGEYDNYIQLPPFRCPAGRQFRIGIHLADGAAYEDFVS